jgi:hypothetical protein
MTIEQRYNQLDDIMKMYFREATLVIAWNLNADKCNAAARYFNTTKRWWQRKKPDDFPHYHATPVRMPQHFFIPPTWHPQYEECKKLIEEYAVAS